MEELKPEKTQAKTSAITVPIPIKEALNAVRMGMSNNRTVTWAEFLELLLHFFLKKEYLEEEIRRLQDTITLIASNLAKAGIARIETGTGKVIIPKPPPAPTHRAPGPKEGEDPRLEVIRELDDLFEHGATPTSHLKSVAICVAEEKAAADAKEKEAKEKDAAKEVAIKQ